MAQICINIMFVSTHANKCTSHFNLTVVHKEKYDDFEKDPDAIVPQPENKGKAQNLLHIHIVIVV